VVPPHTTAEWLETLIEDEEVSPEKAIAIVQLTRRTGDAARDISEDLRKRTIRSLKDAGAGPELIEVVDKFIPPSRADAVRMFGDSLPRDLRLVSSANCLLSVTALTQGDRVVAS
jgi:hypothetical protein